MLRLTREEQILIACLLVAVVVGAVVKHARAQYRRSHPLVEAVATPAPKPAYVELEKARRPAKKIGLEKKDQKSR